MATPCDPELALPCGRRSEGAHLYSIKFGIIEAPIVLAGAGRTGHTLRWRCWARGAGRTGIVCAGVAGRGVLAARAYSALALLGAGSGGSADEEEGQEGNQQPCSRG